MLWPTCGQASPGVTPLRRLREATPTQTGELPMLDTLRHVIEAHGGLEDWNKHRALSVDLVIGGMLWGLKGQAGKLERTNVTVGLGEEWASHHPFGPDIGAQGSAPIASPSR